MSGRKIDTEANNHREPDNQFLRIVHRQHSSIHACLFAGNMLNRITSCPVVARLCNAVPVGFRAEDLDQAAGANQAPTV